MKILFAGNKQRGVSCLHALVNKGHDVVGVIAHPTNQEKSAAIDVAGTALQLGLPLFQPADVNDPTVLDALRRLIPDLIVLAGYGPIVKQEFIDLAPRGCVNLHGGKLPKYRGSSPMNWALINGETEFTLTIIYVDAGVDTGDILAERTFPISVNDTIEDLQRVANEVFPEMLVDVVGQIDSATSQRRAQDESSASYYPLRFPDDGLILWDLFSAEQIHNRIRALTTPYPGAFTVFKGRRVKLLRSELAKRSYFGEPGRVYLKNAKGILVCGLDRCLWVQQAIVEENQEDAFGVVARYDKFATLRDLAAASLMTRGSR